MNDFFIFIAVLTQCFYGAIFTGMRPRGKVVLTWMIEGSLTENCSIHHEVLSSAHTLYIGLTSVNRMVQASDLPEIVPKISKYIFKIYITKPPWDQ